MQSNNFDEIRPFNNDEVPGAIHKLLKEEKFIRLVKFFNPEWSHEVLPHHMAKITDLKQFFSAILHKATQLTIDRTTKGLTFSGLESLRPNKSYVFISNHRDIILDAGFLNFILYNHGYRTSEAIIGDNLISWPWVKDLVKLNQNIIVKRNAPIKEVYLNSLLLSSYIQYALAQKETSIWIAQKEGRTKNGNDTTQSSVLKMLALNHKKDKFNFFQNLDLIPISISYEYEPCLSNKIHELSSIAETGTYQKSFDEDTRSIISGVINEKGNVHISFGHKINLDSFDPNQHFYTQLQKQIDHQIQTNYKLHPNNYIAYDKLYNTTKFEKFYSHEQSALFTQHIYTQLSALPIQRELSRQIALEIYANPLKNHLIHTNS